MGKFRDRFRKKKVLLTTKQPDRGDTVGLVKAIERKERAAKRKKFVMDAKKGASSVASFVGKAASNVKENTSRSKGVTTGLGSGFDNLYGSGKGKKKSSPSIMDFKF